MSRASSFLTALFRYGDVHYTRRLLARAASNVKLVLGGLGSEYVRINPWGDFGGAEGGDCERMVQGEQPPGFVRMHLIPYHHVLDETEGKVIVEAGTNEGYGAALFATRAREVHAFDLSADAIATATRQYPLANVHFAVHDVTKPFPLPPESADMVFSSEVIEHLPDGNAFLDAAWTVLKPGGVLIVKTPNDDFNRYENRLNPHHVNSYDAARLTREIARRFESVQVTGLIYDVELSSDPEDRFSDTPPEAVAYAPGESIEIDRVIVTRMRVTPRWVDSTSGRDAEYLFARATRAPQVGAQERS